MTMALKKSSLLIFVLISLLIVETYIIIQQASTIKKIEEKIPILLKGETIDYFDMIDINNESIDASVLKNSSFNLIFIFDQPCSRCSRNILYWKKIKKLVKDKIACYGIVLSEYENMINFANEGGLNFNLYFPIDEDKFKNKLKIRLKLSQTIILNKNRVMNIHIGNLTPNEFSDILNQIRILINTMEQ